MNKPTENKTETLITSGQPNKQPKSADGELTDQDLDNVTGGVSNVQKTTADTSSSITGNLKN